ncbi:uracil-DNA glycosylase family protein [Flectobacillus sp. DC10W]|uniref:Uracil-DNA glycosylase family protein n=1 Tax=Flectobacillus longus TaxID=2984207 RepID=A0ABT6YIT6_9BACT|nr:uracil-DNA glycosylase family protein [Flectobacillus longus]MDI9863506.1 uracil-DNA glycosylase family protein [Flectobacillus longus]
MDGSQRVLNRSGGSLNADIMFVGEAPGRLGADSSGIPFHGDKSGHNFEELLDFAQIDRSKIFVTNSVLCNPKDETGNNSTPTKQEIQNCASNLADQIKILNPRIVVTLGAVALESTKYINQHNLVLRESVRTANDWFNRLLIPLYHPGQRAMLHRSFANQRSDYQFVFEQLKKINKPLKKTNSIGSIKYDILAIIKEILLNQSSIDYFKLHKLFYLIEYNYYKLHNTRLTNAYIVRQKDGPYCTDLHFQKLKKALPELQIRQINGNLIFNYTIDIFTTNDTHIEGEVGNIIKETIKKYGNMSNSEIKTKVYLTDPMKAFLRLEKNEKVNLYNVPIQFNLT